VNAHLCLLPELLKQNTITSETRSRVINKALWVTSGWLRWTIIGNHNTSTPQTDVDDRRMER